MRIKLKESYDIIIKTKQFLEEVQFGNFDKLKFTSEIDHEIIDDNEDNINNKANDDFNEIKHLNYISELTNKKLHKYFKTMKLPEMNIFLHICSQSEMIFEKLNEQFKHFEDFKVQILNEIDFFYKRIEEIKKLLKK